MVQIQIFEFVVRASTRSYGDDHWRATEAGYIEAWKLAVALFSKREVVVEKVVHQVSIDWTPMLRLHERHYSAMAYLERGGRQDMARRIWKTRFPRRAAKITISVKTNSKKSQSSQSVAEAVIYDIFLIMNIAVPGSCNFYRSNLVGPKAAQEISLSSDMFELCVLRDQPKKTWLEIQFIPLESVLIWYESIRQGVGQIPSNPTERAMFALLHLTKLDGDVVAIIWFFYALESLLQTNVGENFGSIVRRLALVLELSADDMSVIRKKLRKLYDIRSALVHGGYEVTHPMNDESVDARAGQAFSNLVDAIGFCHVIILGAFQKMALKGRSQLRFEEIIVGLDGSAD